MATIGENIKKLREQHGMSQSELAAKIGKSRTAVWQYERGETVPRMGAIEDIAHVFGVKKSAIIDNRAEYGIVSLMSDNEHELIELYRQLPTKAQHALIVGLRDYVS